MNMSEFYSEFLFRYQTDAAPRHISINAYCISEGIEYRNFIKWYVSTQLLFCLPFPDSLSSCHKSKKSIYGK